MGTEPEQDRHTDGQNRGGHDLPGECGGWAMETMMMINNLTPQITGKSFDPGWFVLRERLEEAGRIMDAQPKPHIRARNQNERTTHEAV